MKTKKEFTNYKRKLILQLKNKLQFFLIGLTVIVISLISLYAFIPKNTFTKAKKNDKKSASLKKSSFPKTYITKDGDYLWQIAENNYGSGLNAYDIAQVNKLNDPNNIPPGTKLLLPDVTPKTPTKGKTSSIQSEQVTFLPEKYTVLPGDSLSIIAYKVYGDYNAWPVIAKANNLHNAETIEIGMVLTIPR